MSSTRNRLQQFIGELRREGRTKSCFAADSNCSNTIVKAHSVQNNRILTRLADNGEVIQLKHDIREEDFKIAPKPVGRRVASVATNFCGMHDTNIFLPIEQRNYTPGDFQQEFLFAYRAYAREYHAKLEQTIMFKSAMEKLDTPSQKEIIADGLQGSEKTLKEMELYRSVLNQARQSSDFTQIHTYPLMLTVFPQGLKTHVLLSCFRKDKKSYACIPKQILSRTKAEQKIIISNIILAHIENLFISPSWWESRSKETQVSIANRFSETIASDNQALSNMLCINMLE
jgi:hypothetical protein